MHDHDKQIPIWFFIGALLALYGLLILGAGIYGWLNPPPPDKMVKLWRLHAAVWWGAGIAILGLVYVVRFWPSKPESLTGKLEDKKTSGPPTGRSA
jgi:hypothetical protein